MLKDNVKYIRNQLENLYDGLIPSEENEGVPMWYGEYFETALDIDYVVNTRNELRGVIILMACGGPTIKVDTYNMKVIGTWGNEYYQEYLMPEVCSEIEQFFEEVRG